MDRRTDLPRDTRPSGPSLFRDQEQKARLEARNGLLQFDEVLALIDKALKSETNYQLRPSTIQHLHRIAIKDIYTCAGNYRTVPVTISQTDHQPPSWEQAPMLVEEMCDYVNANPDQSPVHLSSYVMWRVNWIHPFAGGNGRTARAVSYLALCVKLGYKLPGVLTIPEQIVDNRQPYYAALDQADAACRDGRQDVSAMDELLSRLLAKQLVNVHELAVGKK
jgi:Fic family protein